MLCSKCFQPIDGTFVRALGKPWHDGCFVCGQCKKPIRDAQYASEGEVAYHGDCLAVLRGEVCHRCSKPIMGTVTTALGRKWHPDCFACDACALPILTTQFSSRDGRPYHIHCQLPTTLSPRMTPATPPIIPQQLRTPSSKSPGTPVSHHLLAQSPISMIDGRVAATGVSPAGGGGGGADVSSSSIAMLGPTDICQGCFLPIRGGITTTALGRTFHPDCFKCGKCGSPVRENKFKTEGANVYHINYPLRICRGCYKPITTTELTEAMDELWHPECFTCHTCGERIHGREFSRDGNFPVHIHCKRTTATPTTMRHTQSAQSSTSPPPQPDQTSRTLLSTPSKSPPRVPTEPQIGTTTTHTFVEKITTSPAPPVSSPNPAPHRMNGSDVEKSVNRQDQSSSSLALECKQCCQPISKLVVTAFGFHYHPECFACGLCGLPVLDSDFLNSGGSNKPFHKLCIANLSVGHLTVSTAPRPETAMGPPR